GRRPRRTSTGDTCGREPGRTRRWGLYPLPPTLQRQRLADLLGLDQRLIAIIAEPVGVGVLVQRAVADQLLAAVQHDVAERRHPACIVALEEPRCTALAIPDLAGQYPGVLQVLLVLLVIPRRLGIVVAVAERERLGALCALDPHHVLERARLTDVAVPVREQR